MTEKLIVEIFGRPDEKSSLICIKRKELGTEREVKRFAKKWRKRGYDPTGVPYVIYTHTEHCDMTPVHTDIHVLDRRMQIA